MGDQVVAESQKVVSLQKFATNRTKIETSKQNIQINCLLNSNVRKQT